MDGMNIETIKAYDIRNDHWVFIFRDGENTLFAAHDEDAAHTWPSSIDFEAAMLQRAMTHFEHGETPA